MQGIRIGTTAGRFFGPPGMVIGGTAGLIIAGISGAMLGGSTGTQLGSMIDDKILNNHKCLDCKHTFSVDTGSKKDEYLYEHSTSSDDNDDFHPLSTSSN